MSFIFTKVKPVSRTQSVIKGDLFLFSHCRVWWHRGLQHIGLLSLSLSPGVKLMSIELVKPSSHLLLYRPLLLPSIFPSIRVFSSESALCIRWPKYRSFSISPSNEYSGLISFKIDWFHLLGVWGTFKSLLQHHSWKAPILWHSAFFMVQLPHP